MKKILFILMVIGIVITNSINLTYAEEYASEKYNFKIICPENWAMNSKASSSKQLFENMANLSDWVIFIKKTDSELAMLTVYLFEYSKDDPRLGLTLEEQVKGFIEKENYEIIQPTQQLKINGKEGLRFIVNSKKNGKVLYSFFRLANDRVLEMQCAVRPNDNFEQYLPIFEKTIDKIEFNN